MKFQDYVSSNVISVIGSLLGVAQRPSWQWLSVEGGSAASWQRLSVEGGSVASWQRLSVEGGSVASWQWLYTACVTQ